MAPQRRLILTALFLSIPASLSAQTDSTAVLAGRIIDQAGAGIADARVLIAGRAHTTTADSTGAYVISGIRPGTYVVRFRYVGHIPVEVAGIELRAGARHREVVVLPPRDVPHTTRPVPGEPASAREAGLRAHWRGRAMQLGWPVLRDITPPPGTRELRLESGGGRIDGPWTLVRLVVGPDSTWGEIREVWRHPADSTGPLQVREVPQRSCTGVDSVTTICTIRSDRVDWQALADSVGGLGLWERFVDEGVDRNVDYISDQGYLFAEASIDGAYHSASYYGPTHFTDPQTRALLAVEQLFGMTLGEQLQGGSSR